MVSPKVLLDGIQGENMPRILPDSRIIYDTHPRLIKHPEGAILGIIALFEFSTNKERKHLM
jgi:hypothetical protein